MLFSTIAQPQIFLWMLLSGMPAAVWYGVVNALRKRMQAGVLLSFLLDCAFSLGLAAILIAFFLLGNYGQFRLYGLIACGCGFALTLLLKPIADTVGARIRRIVSRMAKNRLFNIIFK